MRDRVPAARWRGIKVEAIPRRPPILREKVGTDVFHAAAVGMGREWKTGCTGRRGGSDASFGEHERSPTLIEGAISPAVKKSIGNSSSATILPKFGQSQSRNYSEIASIFIQFSNELRRRTLRHHFNQAFAGSQFAALGAGSSVPIPERFASCLRIAWELSEEPLCSLRLRSICKPGGPSLSLKAGKGREGCRCYGPRGPSVYRRAR